MLLESRLCLVSHRAPTIRRYAQEPLDTGAARKELDLFRCVLCHEKPLAPVTGSGWCERWRQLRRTPELPIDPDTGLPVESDAPNTVRPYSPTGFWLGACMRYVSGGVRKPYLKCSG